MSFTQGCYLLVAPITAATSLGVHLGHAKDIYYSSGGRSCFASYDLVVNENGALRAPKLQKIASLCGQAAVDAISAPERLFLGTAFTLPGDKLAQEKESLDSFSRLWREDAKSMPVYSYRSTIESSHGSNTYDGFCFKEQLPTQDFVFSKIPDWDRATPERTYAYHRVSAQKVQYCKTARQKLIDQGTCNPQTCGSIIRQVADARASGQLDNPSYFQLHKLLWAEWEFTGVCSGSERYVSGIDEADYVKGAPLPTPEQLESVAKEVYSSVLGRNPSSAEIEAAKNSVYNKSVVALRADLVKRLSESDEAFVFKAYSECLGRPSVGADGNTQGRDHWLRELAAKGRAHVKSGVCDSPEAFVRNLFVTCKGVSRSGDMGKWINDVNAIGREATKQKFETQEGGACLRDIYRSNAGSYHLYSIDRNEGPNAGFPLEGVSFRVATKQIANSVALRRCRIPSSGLQFLSTDAGCEGQQAVGVLGYVLAQKIPGVSELVRCNARFVTKDRMECVNARFNIDGQIGFEPVVTPNF